MAIKVSSEYVSDSKRLARLEAKLDLLSDTVDNLNDRLCRVEERSDVYGPALEHLENVVSACSTRSDDLEVKCENIEERLTKVIDHIGSILVAAQKKENEAIKIANSFAVRLCSLEERDRFQRNASPEEISDLLHFPNAPKAEAPRVVTREDPIDQLRCSIVCGTRTVWIVVRGTALDGFEFEGPFNSQAEAQAWGEDVVSPEGFCVTTLR